MFSIVEDPFDALTAGVPGWASTYAIGDDEEAHPLTLQAAGFATSSIRNALLVRYTTDSVDTFTPDDVDGEMLLHWRNLAVYERAANGGGRSDSVIEDYDRADRWLQRLRKGEVVVDGLVLRSSVATGARGKGLVRYRGKCRQFSPDNDEYRSRNPKI